MSDNEQTHLDLQTNTAQDTQTSADTDYVSYSTIDEDTEVDFYETYDKVMSELSRPTSKLQAAEH